jgi:hypothetical protein
VVGQGEGLVALLGCRGRELNRMRRPVQERERRMTMELHI